MCHAGDQLACGDPSQAFFGSDVALILIEQNLKTGGAAKGGTGLRDLPSSGQFNTY